MLTKIYVPGFCLLFMLATSACNKQNHEPDSDGTVLSRINSYDDFRPSGGTKDTTTTYFNYNGSRLLASVITVTKSVTDTTVFTYNSQNQLIATRQSNSATGAIAQYQFIYDAQGHVSRKTGIPLLANLSINDHTYGYDADNRVVADSIHNGNSNEVFIYTAYEYDGGNISRFTSFTKNNGNFVPDTSITTYYDARVNPYYQNRSVFYYAYDNAGALSESNAIPALGSGNYYSTFEYYSNGLLRNAITKKAEDGDSFVVNYVYTK